MTVSSAVAAATAAAAAGASAATAAPFVGRERELTALERHATEARHGEPRVVFVEGRAGVGKSALLARFLRTLPDANVVRASGAESEQSLPYGLIGQLIASADLASRDAPLATADPLVVGADLAVLLSQAHATGRLVVLAVDDLHWADPGSAAALLFALRRLHGEAFFGVLCARPAELGMLGDGWERFANGDHRASRLRLGGLTIEEVQSLAQATGAGGLSRRAASRLVSHTGGNPGHCRAAIEEIGESDPGTWDGPGTWGGPGDALPVPRQFSRTILTCLAALTPAARDLADAAAILGRSGSLSTAAMLACLPDPLPALGELIATGLVEEQIRGSGNQILFADPLTHHVIQDDMEPVRRRLLHQQAAALASPDDALGHRVAAATGHDAALAADLEAAAQAAGANISGQGEPARTAIRTTQPATRRPDTATQPPHAEIRPAPAQPARTVQATQAAAWLAQASALTPVPADAGRLILDALDVLLRGGDVAGAEALAPRVADTPRTPRRSAVLGHLDLLAGRPASAEALLRDAWHASDPAREPLTGVRAATGLLSCCLISGRLREAVTWGERAADAA